MSEEPTKHRLDSDRGEDMRAAALDERRKRDQRHRWREEQFGAKLDAMKRPDVLQLAERIGREFGRHLQSKISGRRSWRANLSTNDRRLLLTQLETEHHATPPQR